ncbi:MULTISPECIES: LysR family transcriptional regulator [unclassified Francisella]|uniref:LysR family transcriptional regulator n=1 Tax=unclassified Francisella TaxID=2610885 RepID=UPI002E377BD0|nr:MULTISPECIES: LysR family transcriptional regulator [unclassified Francisella]MED7819979.1 LysR family transcriptional regulator [Francisella sp. 19S2-4]MED7830799.1 LysR family transcriptional regulator [Francisella sp. 19S2-10]
MKDYKKIPISLFEVFHELVLHGSFTNTAKAIGVTKAAISHSIKLLEKELKVDLINRTTRTLSLTHEGKILFDYCANLQQEIVKVRDLAESFHSEPSGILRISTKPFFARKILLKLIKEYSKKFPKVQIEVSVEEKLPDFKTQEADIVLGVNWPPPEDIIARRIAKTRYVLCTSPKYINERGTPKNLEDLSNHSVIPHRSRSTPVVNTKNNIKVNIHNPILSADSTEFIKECVLDGMGIAQFHEYIVRKELENGKLVEILPNEFSNEQELFIYYPKNKFVQPKIREFVNLVINSELLTARP